MTRPYTPPITNVDGSTRIRVKRSCSNCSRDLGDATNEELGASVFGEPLPDTRDECGCPRVIMQLAMMTNLADHHASGTAIWDHLDPVGRQSYLEEAGITVRAMVHLGWGPAPVLTEAVLDRAAVAAWASTGPSVANGFGDAEAWADADSNQRNRWRARAAAAIASTRNEQPA